MIALGFICWAIKVAQAENLEMNRTGGSGREPGKTSTECGFKARLSDRIPFLWFFPWRFHVQFCCLQLEVTNLFESKSAVSWPEVNTNCSQGQFDSWFFPGSLPRKVNLTVSHSGLKITGRWLIIPGVEKNSWPRYFGCFSGWCNESVYRKDTSGISTISMGIGYAAT